VEKRIQRYQEKDDFKLDVKSLKIACNFPEMSTPKERSLMDVYVFLEALNVKDLANKSQHYSKLFHDKADKKKDVEDIKVAAKRH
jgi:hypothetical protein